MAGYENRESNKDIIYLRSVLGKVDDNIVVPDSVRGDALRRKLDNIQLDQAPKSDRKMGTVFGLRWLSLQSGLTYAAAFLLIVGLYYYLGDRQPPDMIDGSIELPQQGAVTEQVEEAVPDIASFRLEAPADNGVESAVDDDVHNSATGGDNIATGGNGGTTTPTPPAVGGSSMASNLGSQSGYTYAWRSNDASDPDKGAYPITIDVIQDADTQTVAQIDIPDMQSIEECFFTSSTLSVVGKGDSGVITRSYSIEVPEEPQTQTVLSQPGTYVGSRLYNDVVHVVTYSDDINVIDCEVEELPGAVAEAACVISAVDVVDGGTNQKAFLGAEDDISLFDRSALITYEGEAEESVSGQENSGISEAEAVQQADDDAGAQTENTSEADGASIDETAKYYVQILLNGTDISLNTIS